MLRSLQVFLNGVRVGTLHEHNDLWAFEYDPPWVASETGFDLSPQLSRTRLRHEDGGSRRPVQWYFDNLLPEEHMRAALNQEAQLAGDDAFALLQYLGAESAGSLVLVAPGQSPAPAGGLQHLPDAVLNLRIQNLPRATLGQAAPKKMSMAGAQHKLLVVVRDDAMWEPVGQTPSTHLLKPNHPGETYPHSVINEFFTMQLARRMKLQVPRVFRRYVPAPVYLVERFDRDVAPDGATHRRHIVDACQLLDKARTFKYQAATLGTLLELVKRCRNRMSTRTRLYEWLVFNLLVGNNDNHLKNLSFHVSAEGVALASHYDLLSTGVYLTRACADDRAIWPGVELAIPVPNAAVFADLTFAGVVQAGVALGLSQAASERVLQRMLNSVLAQADAAMADIERDNAALPPALGHVLAGEMRLLRAIRHVVVQDMVARLRAGSPATQGG